ncbi:MAG TPA: hypothetical protein VH599_16535 [Ktedonobacterales bacterium]|jgi:hypothetical protein
MSDEAQAMAEILVQSSEEKSALQQALLVSARLFTRDVLRFSHDWQVRWIDVAVTQELAEISETLLVALAGLESELIRPEGPSQFQVSQLLGALLGMPTNPGPVTRLQGLIKDDPATMSLEDQRLLSEADTLFIQLDGFRAQWQDYLSLATAVDRTGARKRTEPLLPPLPPNRRGRSGLGAGAAEQRAPFPSWDAATSEASTPGAFSPPASSPPPAWQNAGLLSGMGGVLKALLPFLLALVVIVFLSYVVISRLPKTEGQTSPGRTLATALSTPTATPASQPSPPASATSQPSPQPSPTPTLQPTATTPAGPAQLSVNPPLLALPCPGTGEAPLQLANTGSAPLDWQATAAGASGGDAGILLDGAPSEQGHLNPGEVAQISVTAQTTTAQGTITITSSGGSGPVTVSFRVNC